MTYIPTTDKEADAAQIAHLARRLDVLAPGWAERMPATWSLADPENCVLHHAFGHFIEGLDIMHQDGYKTGLDCFGNRSRFHDLWQAEIDLRRTT